MICDFTINTTPETAALRIHGLLAHVEPDVRKKIYAGGKQSVKYATKRIETELKHRSKRKW